MTEQRYSFSGAEWRGCIKHRNTLCTSQRAVTKFGSRSYFADDGGMDLMWDRGAVAFELQFIKSKHFGQNMDAFWKCCGFSGALCKDFFSPALSSPSLFPHQTSASTDDALKESLCGLHTKQSKAALKASGQRSGEGYQTRC